MGKIVVDLYCCLTIPSTFWLISTTNLRLKLDNKHVFKNSYSGASHSAFCSHTPFVKNGYTSLKIDLGQRKLL